MRTKSAIHVAFVASVLSLASFAASAQIAWTVTANSCAVDDQDLDEFNPNSNNLKFTGTTTGDVVARCNVVNPRDDGLDPNWGVLQVVYRDPDGTGTADQVKAKLIRVSHGGGATTIATFNSNSFLPAPAAILEEVEFFHDFNFQTGAYYIELTVMRSSAADDPAVFLARLALPGPD